MEKLQPLIKHKYWIIGGAALLMPFIGWWLSTGKVAAETQKRWEELTASQRAVGHQYAQQGLP